jgi:hypothetical protein
MLCPKFFRTRGEPHIINQSALESIRVFAIPVKAALANRLEPPKVRGRHPPIDEGSEAEILEWIETQAEKYNPATRTDLRQHCQAKYSVAISRGWVDSFILRH